MGMEDLTLCSLRKISTKQKVVPLPPLLHFVSQNLFVICPIRLHMYNKLKYLSHFFNFFLQNYYKRLAKENIFAKPTIIENSENNKSKGKIKLRLKSMIATTLSALFAAVKTLCAMGSP